MNSNIDLVVTWVDGSDPAWLKQRQFYEPGKKITKASCESRDWGWMRYWFRGVEQNLPWIRRIHFVTWGHLPNWLNCNHPKLHVVRHEDFIPAEYLPTFSSHPIEWNMHRIEGLSEQFIYANDDMYFIGSSKPDDYFQNGFPCDCLCLRLITDSYTGDFGHIIWNNISCINRHFLLKDCMNQNEDKFFASVYSPNILAMNKAGYQLRNFPGFLDEHLPIAFLKSSFETIWKAEPQLLRRTCHHRFRSIWDVSDWLVRYWQLADGNFVPRMPRGKAITLAEPPELLRDTILNPLYTVICLNDSRDAIDFEEHSTYLCNLFEMILPEMSSFELY
ncbi:MAG: Stealth CR1 domain-containing protein [Clostridiales bacterium]|nr:Stealth CR1 domain-containing protein [Clostridiales bacterium]